MMASVRTRLQTQKIFLLSGLDEEERKNFGDSITKLGGLYLNSDSFRQNCTHVICGKLSRSEKFLGACSMGKWILHPDYIRQSAKHQCWLQEELFEWSNYNIPDVPPDLRTAGSRWRFNLEVFQTFPFSGWNVAVVVSGAKKSSVYRRLLACGGAKVYNLKLPVKDIVKVASTLTYIFVNEKNADSVIHLVEYGILCLRPEYIGDYLVKDPSPDPMDYLVQPSQNGDEGDTTIVDINFSQQENTPTDDSQLQSSEVQSLDDYMGLLSPHQLDQSYQNRTYTRKGCSSWSSKSSTPDVETLVRVTRRGSNTSSPSSISKTPEFGSIKRVTRSKASSPLTTIINTPEFGSVKRVTRSNTSSPSSLSNTPEFGSVKRVTRRSVHVLSSQSSTKSTPESGSKVSGHALSAQSSRCNTPEIENHTKKVNSEKELAENGNRCMRSCRRTVPASPKCMSNNQSSKIKQEVFNCMDGNMTIAVKAQHTTCRTGEVSFQDEQNDCGESKGAITSVQNSSPLTPKLSNDKHCFQAFNEYLENVKTVTPRKSLSLIKTSVKRSYTVNTTDVNGHLEEAIPTTSIPNYHSSLQKEILSPVVVLDNNLADANVSNVTDETSANAQKDELQTKKSENGHELFTQELPKKAGNRNDIECKEQKTNESQNVKELSTQKSPTKSINSSDNDCIDNECVGDLQNKNIASSIREQKNCVTQNVIDLEQSVSKEISEKIQAGSEVVLNGKDFTSVRTRRKSSRLTKRNCIVDAAVGQEKCYDQLEKESDLHKVEHGECKSSTLTMNEPTKRKCGEVVEGATKRIKVYDDKFHWMPAVSSFNTKDDKETDHKGDTATPFSTSLTGIIRTCLDESSGQHFVSAGLDMFKSSVTPKKYPDPSLLHLIMVDILMNRKINELQANRAYCVLMKVLECHSPTTLVAINMYNEALVFNSEQEYSDNTDWIFVKNVISDLIHGTIKRSNGLYLLRFLVAVLEQNYLHVIEKYNNGFCCIQKLKSSMLGQLLWPSLNQIFFNSRCKEILVFLEETASVLIPDEEEKSELIKLLVSLYGMAANLCYLSENHSANLPANAAIFGKNVASFLHEITKIINHRLGDLLLKEVMMLLQPSWFCLGVACYLLADYDDYLLVEGLPKEQVTMRDVVSRYFYLLPKMTSKAESLIQSPHRKRLTMSSPATPQLSIKGSISPKPLLSSQCNSPDEKAMTKLSKTINKRNCKGETPLHTACIRDDVVKLNQLLKVPGVDVNTKDNAGWTPMHEACNHGSIQCVKALLQFVPAKTVDHYFRKDGAKCKKVDLLLANDEGIAPLHDAVLNNRKDVCLLLLQHAGSSLLKQKTSLGYTPVDLAVSDDMRDILLSYADDPLSLTSSQESSQGHSIPGSHLYDQALGLGQQMKCTSVEECIKYVSIISFLISSYITAMDITSKRPSTCINDENIDKENCVGQFKNQIDKVRKSDAKIVQDLQKYINRFGDHVKKICDNMSERLEMELAMLMCLQCV